MSDVDPTPETPVTIGDRMGWWRGDLSAQLASQHAEMMAAMATQHETTLSAINRLRGTTPAEGDPDLRVDMAMLSAALTALRGLGPENTLRSINQSIWNLAGPAPGRSLADLYNLLVYEEAGSPNIVWTTAGLLHVIRLALYNSDRTLDAADLLERINNAIGGEPGSSLEIASVRGLLDTIRVNTRSMADCCAAMNVNPLTTMPPGVCAAPFVSVSSVVMPVSGAVVSPLTVADWDFSSTTEFEAGSLVGLGTNSNIIKTVQEPIDWSGYRFYVASRAQMFGAAFLDPQRWPTNRWINLPYASSLQFSVDGDQNALTVYICPATGGALGSCPGSEDPRQISSWQATYKGISSTRYWEMVDSAGGTTWSTIEQIRLETPAATPQSAIRITRTITNVGLCIAWDVSGESDTVQEIGIRAFTEDVGYWGEVGLTVAPVVIAASGASGSLIREMNLSGGYSPDDFALTPYVYYAATHSAQPNVSVAISFVALTAS